MTLLDPAARSEQMRAEFYRWVEEQGCDTDGAWSAWQGAWDRQRERCAAICTAMSYAQMNVHQSKGDDESAIRALESQRCAAAIRGNATTPSLPDAVKEACDLLDGVSDLVMSPEWNERRNAVLDALATNARSA